MFLLEVAQQRLTRLTKEAGLLSSPLFEICNPELCILQICNPQLSFIMVQQRGLQIP